MPSNDATVAAYIDLMKRCWAQDPEQRPGFQEVAHRLRSFQGVATEV